MRLLLFIAIVSPVACQQLHVVYGSYNLGSKELSGAGFCPSTEMFRKEIKQDVVSFLKTV